MCAVEFYTSKYSCKYDLIYEYTIKDLAQLILSFIVKRLYVGDVICILDTIDKWRISYIYTIDHDKIFIHYLGWEGRWDEWIDISSDRIKLYLFNYPNKRKTISIKQFKKIKNQNNDVIIIENSKCIKYSWEYINTISSITNNTISLFPGYYFIGKYSFIQPVWEPVILHLSHVG